MEDNQENKLDSFFRKSLENQAFPPPENLWSNIAAETIAKESIGIAPLLKYTLLSLGIIITAGIALWFLTDNEVMEKHHQEITLRTTEIYPKQQVLANQSGETTIKNSSENDVKTEKDDVENSRSNLLNVDNHVEKKSVNATIHRKSRNSSSINIPTIVDTKLSNSVNQTSVAMGNNNGEILTTDNKLINNKLQTLSHKDLFLKDLSFKNHKNLNGKIRPIQSLSDEGKDENKPESTGSKFSLKHPIISFDYGSLWNEWTFKSDKSMTGTNLYPEKGKGYNFKANVSWKLTKRSRMGISFTYNTYDVGAPYVYLPIWSSFWTSPKLNLTTKNGTQYYSAILPTGTVNIPVNRFDGFITKVPNTLDTTRDVFLSENHTMKTYSLALTTQNDLISFKSKKKKYLNFQLYTVADFVFQRQTSYRYIANDARMMLSSSLAVNEKARIDYTSNHLENASDFVFGIRAGLGIRWQFTPRLGLHVEGSTQNSFNTWVQNQELKSYMRSNALNVGVNIGL
ncbi:hypothetical protein [Arcicella lustrica]|uniref:Outer membrane protein beta-barrel domain-containing protein n=1 Tax=Arcicella lustrica TaxID=2984196 RepID=A0ABU5SQA1_9BACT|nr:hypothetical protein [Arcicella sp. DC25W]MEA5429501.1 hypothetical protein [Arcicella sp. DC25W]